MASFVYISVQIRRVDSGVVRGFPHKRLHAIQFCRLATKSLLSQTYLRKINQNPRQRKTVVTSILVFLTGYKDGRCVLKIK